MHLTAFLVGAGSLAVAIGVKFIPEKFLKKMPEFKEDEKALKKQQEAIEKGSEFTKIE
jgi:hypothetical protein